MILGSFCCCEQFKVGNSGAVLHLSLVYRYFSVEMQLPVVGDPFTLTLKPSAASPQQCLSTRARVF